VSDRSVSGWGMENHQNHISNQVNARTASNWRILSRCASHRGEQCPEERRHSSDSVKMARPSNVGVVTVRRLKWGIQGYPRFLVMFNSAHWPGYALIWEVSRGIQLRNETGCSMPLLFPGLVPTTSRAANGGCVITIVPASQH
jgi:hypothetical protein